MSPAGNIERSAFRGPRKAALQALWGEAEQGSEMRNAREGIPNEAYFATTTFRSVFDQPLSGKREGAFSLEIVPEAP